MENHEVKRGAVNPLWLFTQYIYVYTDILCKYKLTYLPFIKTNKQVFPRLCLIPEYIFTLQILDQFATTVSELN